MRKIIWSVFSMGLLGVVLGTSAADAAKPTGNKKPPAAAKPDCSHPDGDGDGHRRVECGGADCDDQDARRFPGNAEVCDAANIDEDCDSTTFGFRDGDGDGHGDARCCNGKTCGIDCDDSRRGVHPDVPEVCNGRDDNCDGVTDEDLMLTARRDRDQDLYGDRGSSVMACPHLVPRGFVTNDADCNDRDPAKNPRRGCS